MQCEFISFFSEAEKGCLGSDLEGILFANAEVGCDSRQELQFCAQMPREAEELGTKKW